MPLSDHKKCVEDLQKASFASYYGELLLAFCMTGQLSDINLHRLW